MKISEFVWVLAIIIGYARAQLVTTSTDNYGHRPGKYYCTTMYERLKSFKTVAWTVNYLKIYLMWNTMETTSYFLNA